MNALKEMFFSTAIGFFTVFNCTAQEPLKTVPYVNVEEYMGKWYEIALFPQSFEKNCTGTTAEYSLNSDGTVRVFNSCHLYTLDGELNTATGEAYVVDTSTNAKLKVSFFKPFYGDYWILDLDENYTHALVGTPDRDMLWILSRTPNMQSSEFEQLKSKATELGFDVSKLQKTVQF